MFQNIKTKPFKRVILVGLLLFFCLISQPAIAADTSPPIGSIKINNGATYTNSINVTLNLSATDTGSGVAEMKFSNNKSLWSNPEPYAATKNWTLTSGSGKKTVYVKFKDNAGNWSKIYSDTIILDTTAPTGSIKINNGATYTNSINVTLKLSATDTGSGVAQMQFSNNNSTYSDPEAYATTKTWNIPSGDGAKIVYVKFKDKAGNCSTVYSDTIILDTTPPTGSIKINNGVTYTTAISVTLNLSASDSGSGLSQMQFSNNNSTWSTPGAYAASKSWNLPKGDGTKTVYVKFKDVSGKWSGVYSDSIILDTTAPATPAVTDDGATTPSSTSLHCRWSSSDSVSGISEYQYKLTRDSTTGLTIVDWTSSGTATEVTRTGLSLTNNKIYYFLVKARNGAGLWSGVGYSDGIKVAIPSDTTPPTGSIKINNDSVYTNSVSVTLNLFAEDNTGGSGLSQMQFSNDGSNWSTPEAYATTKSWTLPSGDGEKKVWVKFKDAAGNWSAPMFDIVILETLSLLNPIGNKSIFVRSAGGASGQMPTSLETIYTTSTLQREQKPTGKDVSQFRPGEIVIKFKSDILEIPPGKRIVKGDQIQINANSVQALNEKFSLLSIERIFKKEDRKRLELKWGDLSNTYLFRFSADTDIEAIVKEYQNDPNIEYVEPNYIMWIMDQEKLPSKKYFKIYK